MISVIISEENILENKIIIDEKGDVNHLKNVFRVKIDEKVRAVDGEKEYLCRVAELDKKSVTLVIDEIFEDRFSTKVKIDAAIGILKNDKMDLTIQKLTEIGINKIIPLSTKRGVAKVSEKKDKWDLIVREALKQCQGVKPLIIDEVTKIEKLKLEDYDLVIVPYECEDEYTLKNLLRKQTKELKSVLYIVGPEGGFDKDELELATNAGADIITLGRRILRTETAGLMLMSVLMYNMEE